MLRGLPLLRHKVKQRRERHRIQAMITLLPRVSGPLYRPSVTSSSSCPVFVAHDVSAYSCTDNRSASGGAPWSLRLLSRPIRGDCYQAVNTPQDVGIENSLACDRARSAGESPGRSSVRSEADHCARTDSEGGGADGPARRSHDDLGSSPQGLSITAIARRTGRNPKTVRKCIVRGLEPPAYDLGKLAGQASRCPTSTICVSIAAFPQLTAASTAAR